MEYISNLRVERSKNIVTLAVFLFIFLPKNFCLSVKFLVVNIRFNGVNHVWLFMPFRVKRAFLFLEFIQICTHNLFLFFSFFSDFDRIQFLVG